MKRKVIKDSSIKSIIFKSNIKHFVKGSMNNITLNKEYEISNQIKTSMVHIVGFLDDKQEHCCFYLRHDSDFNQNIETI